MRRWTPCADGYIFVCDDCFNMSIWKKNNKLFAWMTGNKMIEVEPTNNAYGLPQYKIKEKEEEKR